MNPKFKQRNKESNFSMVQKNVDALVANIDLSLLNLKVIVKGICLMMAYCGGILMLWFWSDISTFYFLTSALLGILCVPMILVIGHEAIHGNFTDDKTVNKIAEHVFYFLGTSSYLWKLRHLNAHHYYTNIRNWDLDIEQSKLIRLDASQEWYKFHRFQAIYMPFLFMFYTINWFFIRDLNDLRNRHFGTKLIKSHPTNKIVFLLLSKIWHLAFLIFIPLALGQSLGIVTIGFMLFHVTASLTTTLVLVSTHIGESHELFSVEPEDNLSYTWVEHQIRTSGNFSTNNIFALNFFGGFNHHLTHHLFPNVPYSLYSHVTPLIKKYCYENDLPYHDYPNLAACIKSHFKRLIKFSKP